MIYSSLVINILFFTIGYSVNTFLLGDKKNVRNIIFSLPIGFGIFSLSWILVNILNIVLVRYENRSLSTIISIIICLIFIIVSIIKTRTHYKNLKKDYYLTASFLAVLALTAIFYYMRTTVLFGDSYTLISWSNSMSYIASKGFSVFGLPHSNLSSFFVSDFYNYPLHPLLSVNLILMIAYAIEQNTNRTENTYIKFIIIVSMVLLFVSNNNFVWQSFYLNLHVITAAYILILTSMFSGNTKFETSESIFIILCLILISLTRMEGIITSFSIILIYLFNIKIDFKVRGAIFSSFLVFSSVFILLLSFALAGNKSYSPERYIVFGFLMLSTYFIDLMIIRKQERILRYLSLILVSLAFIALLSSVLCNKEFLNNLNIVSSNTFEEIFWGLTNHALVLISMIILFYRVKTKRYHEEHDSFIYLFIFSVIMILILSNFHPFRKGWFDSANRMLFHFIPLLVVWAGIEIKKIIFCKDK